MRILVIEDEDRLARSLKQGLEQEGYVVDTIGDGEKGQARALTEDYDLLIVDRHLPGKEGLPLVRGVREEDCGVPVLILTVMSGTDHKIEGLEAGADDYLAKPFVFEELLARVRALLRRPPMDGEPGRLKVGALRINTERREVRLGEVELHLRPKEYGLLTLCAQHVGEIQSRTVIAERVWGDPFYVSDNTIDVTVSNLRSKLEEARTDGDPTERPSVTLETVRGCGYRLTTDP